MLYGTNQALHEHRVGNIPDTACEEGRGDLRAAAWICAHPNGISSDPTQPLCSRNAKLKRGTLGSCPEKSFSV